MTDYILGFAFDPNGSVALIRKERPDWQRGCWNGIGGHLEGGETGQEGMAREFEEEAGMTTEPSQWRLVGKLLKEGVFHCHVYVAHLPELRVNTCTDERVQVFTLGDQPWLGTNTTPAISNIPALLALVVMPPDRQGATPFFTLDYT